MKNKIKFFGLLITVILLTGCTTQLKDTKNKIVTNKETGQTLTKNILCQPTNETVIQLYKDNKVNVNSLPTCANLKITSGGYEGLWTNIFVKPLAWLIIQVGKLVNNYGLAIILTTFLIRLAVMPVTHKTAIQSENMKKAKPELDKLEKKYKDKQTKEAQMQKASEMMQIYQKYQIKPLSGCLLALIQLPLFFAFLEAINRVPAIFENKFLTFHMGTNPTTGLQHGQYQYLILIILIIVTTYLSFKNTLQDQAGSNQKQMKYTLYFMLAFIAIASLTLPTASAIYWIASSLFTIFQNELVKRKKVNDDIL